MMSLRKLYEEHRGKVSDKWSHYLPVYDNMLKSWRERPVALLEIGIQNGGALEIWSRYFAAGRRFVGCDINPDCARLSYDDPRIKVVVGDANTDVVEQAVVGENERFDIVIDDGSHTSSDIIRSFARYFPHLSDDGVFIVEDLHCSYWEEFGGGLHHPMSSISFFKLLADVINHEHWGVPFRRIELLAGFSQSYGVQFDEELLSMVHSVSFMNSLCVIRRAPAAANRLGVRFIAGSTEQIKEVHNAHRNEELVAPSQASNPTAQVVTPPAERVDELIQRVKQLQQQLDQERARVAAMEQSNSWRLTAPLRTLGTLVRHLRRDNAMGMLNKLVRVLRLVVPALRQTGGWSSLVRKSVHVARQQGWRGLKDTVIRLEMRMHPARRARADYARWVKMYDSPDEITLAALREAGAQLARQPLLSIVMPTYRPNLTWIAEAIDSVRAQTWSNWQLCIADDASGQPELRKLLEDYVRRDPRIEVVFRDRNGHIAEASNSALALARGDWILLLDHDDLLPPHALYCVAKAINDHPQARLIYSDEDKIDERGRRFDPYFKTDWNPDLFYSHNMICHLGCYETDLVREVGGFRVGTEGAQDYDLALRCIERVTRDQIIHIPRVLYHWRVHAQSTASSAAAKPYAMLAGERALNEHFRRIGVRAVAEYVGCGYRTRYELPSQLPLVSLLIPTRDMKAVTEVAVQSILEKTTYSNYEIIIIDNGSVETETLNWFETIQKRDTRVRVVRYDHPFNFSAICNFGVRHAQGSVIGLINNDVEVISPEWLTEMVSHALRPEVGCVGAKLYYGNDTLQHGGVVLGVGGFAGHSHRFFLKSDFGYHGRMIHVSGVSAVTGACLLVKRGLYEAVGGLDESNLRVALNDVDFCLKVREAGYRNVWTPYAELYHHESISRGAEDTPEKIERFAREIEFMKTKWGNHLLNDPFYSPNLTLDFEDFSFAWPPRVPQMLSDSMPKPTSPALAASAT